MGLIIRALEQNESTLVQQRVTELFTQMYTFMSEKGLCDELADNGAKIWLKSMMPMLGKTTIIFLALQDDQPIGFCAGNIRISPAFLGSVKTGHLSHLYLVNSCRRIGYGIELYRMIEEWFCEKKVQSVELDVLSNNFEAIHFWEKAGYRKIYLRMRKQI